MTLKDAIRELSHIFGSDSHLVHGQVERSKPTGRPVRGKYNLSLPTTSQNDLDALEKADTVEVECMDSRLSTKGISLWSWRKNVRISMAGGGVQPDETRRKAVAKVAAEIHQVNPRAIVKLAGHDEVCKGFDHFSGGRASIYHNWGKQAEQKAIADELSLTADEAIRQGADPKRLRLVVDEIDRNRNRYKRSRNVRPRR